MHTRGNNNFELERGVDKELITREIDEIRQADEISFTCSLFFIPI